MGCGGQPTFVGAPSEVLKYFSVHRLGEVFDRTEELGAECWRARFEATVSATIKFGCPSSWSAWPPLGKVGGTIMKRRSIML